LSNTVYFRNPGDAIVKKYSLATMHLDIDNKPADFAHVVVMPHVSRNALTEFLTDLESRQSLHQR
jgi:histidine decarboxylase